MQVNPTEGNSRQGSDNSNASQASGTTHPIPCGAGLVCEEDEGWDDIGKEEGFYEILRRAFVHTGYLVTYDGNKYLYVDNERRWCLITSNTAVKHIFLTLGIRIATKNYATAADPFMPWLHKHAFSITSRMAPSSVCIGSRRREVYLDGDVLNFADSRALLEHIDGSDERAAFCNINPIGFTQLPVFWEYPGTQIIESYLYPLFRSDVAWIPSSGSSAIASWSPHLHPGQ